MARLALAALVLVALVAAPAGGADLNKRQPKPRHGKSVVVKPTKGHVILYRRGNRKPVALPVGQPVSVPLGSELDTTNGTATVTAAPDSSGDVERGTFSRGLFGIKQSGSTTAVSLGGNGARMCTEPRRLTSRVSPEAGFVVIAGASASRAASGPVARWVAMDMCDHTDLRPSSGQFEVVDLGSRRASVRRAKRLFGSGAFRTRGRRSSATVRGRIRTG